MASSLIFPTLSPLPLPKRQYSYACINTPRSQNPNTNTSSSPSQLPLPPNPKPRSADSTDWIASTLTRRYGLGAGLAWASFLLFGFISEQIKTRFEISQQESNTKDIDKEEELILSNGIRYCDLRIGGGPIPLFGDLVVVDLKGRVLDSGEVFVDTFEEGSRPLVMVMGSRPYARGMCEGVEYALRSMRAGGKRRVVVPPELGFGKDEADFGMGVRVSPGAVLEFVVQVDKVSVAPS